MTLTPAELDLIARANKSKNRIGNKVTRESIVAFLTKVLNEGGVNNSTDGLFTPNHSAQSRVARLRTIVRELKMDNKLWPIVVDQECIVVKLTNGSES